MKTLFVIFLSFSTLVFAQNTDEKDIEKSIQNLFVAMKNADSAGIKNSFTENAIMQTFGKNGEIRTEKVSGFATQVGKSEKNSLDERFTIKNILIDENMASVWAPYEFYYQGKFSHCGVNNIQMVKEKGFWKINYIIDTRRKENCKK